MPRAFTRAVSPRLADCQLTHQPRVLIDAAKAAQQHAAYEQALADAGFEIVRLPELADDPDAVFVEDTAVILDGHAIITRPGAASRIGEIDSTTAGLSPHLELHRIESGHLDGGDVLRIGKRLYVGRSTRTNVEGIIDLSALVTPLGFEVHAARLRGCLHLKTGASFAGLDASGTPILLYDANSVDPTAFGKDVQPVAVSFDEPAAANCIRAGEHIIMPAGNPRTAALLRDRGLTVIEVDVSELQKAEAGVTCMSLIDDRP